MKNDLGGFFNTITGAESCFRHYDLETKEQWEVWGPKNSIRPTTARRNKSYSINEWRQFSSWNSVESSQFY